MIRIEWVLALALPGLGACAGTEHCACAGGMTPGTSTEACECGPGSDASQASPDASDAGVRPSPDASDAGVRPPATDGQVDSTGASFALPVCNGSPDVRLALTQERLPS